MTRVHVLAPAKINLGLSVLGKRPDGYHDIDTIMAMIDLCDDITLSVGVVSGISISGMDAVPGDSNLMTKAIRLWCDEAYVHPDWHIEITKRIPAPAGIGGGSSDAAAILRALNALHDEPLSDAAMHEIAAEIGADCPFFLGSSGTRATGTGTDLEPLQVPGGWVVLVVPPVIASNKTASLYGALEPTDYGVRKEIDAIANNLKDGTLPMGVLPNSFLRPARSVFHGLPELEELMNEVCGSCSLSGAGPALYALSDSESEARIWAEHLRAELPEDVFVIATSFLSETPQPRRQP